MKVLAVIPAYQNEDTVADTVLCLRRIDEVDRVIVVDDASTDRTAVNSVSAGAVVVSNGVNLGKGRSLNRVITGLDFDYLLLIDADLGEYAAEADLLLAPVMSGKADLAIAAFPPPATKGGFGIVQGLGRWGIAALAGRRMQSPLSGQRVFNRKLFERTAPFDPGFGLEVGMTIDALRDGFRVIEVETNMSHRETGRDIAGFIHRGRQALDVSKALLRRMLACKRPNRAVAGSR